MNIENLPSQPQDWMIRLWHWADINKVADYHYCQNKEKWLGIPRNADSLLKTKELDISVNSDIRAKFCQEIGQLTWLEKLSIFSSRGNIDELPSSIENLVNLTELYINCRDVKDLPSGICKLRSLEKLFIVCNDLKVLPEDIGDLKNLRIISLYIGNIVLPKSIVKLTALTHLVGDAYLEIPLPYYQARWIRQLIKSGCDVQFSEYLLKRSRRWAPFIFVFETIFKKRITNAN